MQICLRYDNPDGSCKEWHGSVVSGGLSITWGRIGKTLQGKILPPDRCYHRSPYKELVIRAEKKKKKGYYVVYETVKETSIATPEEPARIIPPDKAKKISSSLAAWSETDQESSWF